MTDPDFDTVDPTLLAAALDLLRERGPLAEEQLAELLAETGFGDAAAVLDRLGEYLDEGCLAALSDGRCAAADALVAGRVFTHRLTAAEIEADVIAAADVSPLLLRWAGDDGDGGAEVLFASSDADRLADRGLDAEAVPAGPAIAFPRGTFADRAPGDLLAFTDSDGRLTHTVVTGTPEPTRALTAAVVDLLGSRDRAQLDAPVALEPVLLSLLADDPDAFTAPALPLTETLAQAGLVRAGEVVAPAGFDFDGFAARAAVDAYAEQVGIAVEAVPGVVLFASLVDALDRGADTDLDERFGAGRVGLYTVLADPDVAETVFERLVEEGIAFGAIERAARWVRDRGPRRAAAGALWLAGAAADADGRVEAAERCFEESVDLDGAFEPALFCLARYASDRGDAVRARSLLHRIPGGDDHPFSALLEYYQPPDLPDLGRNDPCWCGSGRKYKVCHRGQAGHSLAERAVWLYTKALQHLAGIGWSPDRAELVALAGPAELGGADPEAVVDDVLLGEGGALAEFVECRGHLLPPDERELAAAWGAARHAVYEVGEVRADGGVTLRDVRTGHESVLSCPDAGPDLVVGELLCSLVLPVGDDRRIFGGAARLTPDRAETVRAVLDGGDVDPARLVAALAGHPDPHPRTPAHPLEPGA